MEEKRVHFMALGQIFNRLSQRFMNIIIYIYNFSLNLPERTLLQSKIEKTQRKSTRQVASHNSWFTPIGKL